MGFCATCGRTHHCDGRMEAYVKIVRFAAQPHLLSLRDYEGDPVGYVLGASGYRPGDIAVLIPRTLVPRDDSTISDGHGSTWSAWCNRCGRKSMRVMRPGKVQCGECG